MPVQGGVVHVVGGKGEVKARGKDHWPGGGEQVDGALRAGAMVRGEGRERTKIQVHMGRGTGLISAYT